MKNIPEYTELCFKIENWQAKLESEKAIPLDEQDFSWLIYPQSKYLTKFYGKIIRKLFNWRDAWVLYYSILTPLFNVLTFAKCRRIYFKEQHTTPILGDDGLTFKHDSDKWFYENGKIINGKTNREAIYFHFMIFKKNGFRTDYFWKENYYQLPKELTQKQKIVMDKNGFFLIK